LIIDIFAHIYPIRFLKEYVRNILPPLMSMVNIAVDGEFKYFVDEEIRLRVMDKYGIDIQALSLTAPPMIWDMLDDEKMMKVTKAANDGVAEIVEKNSERFIGIATLPRLDGEYIDELRRCVRELGMKGVQIFTNIRGKPLDLFTDFFSEVTKLDIPVLIHPIDWSYYPWIKEYRLVTIVGWPFDTTLAVLRIVFSGLLEKYPNLKIVTHHLGGMIPFFIERIRDFYDESIQHPDVYFGYAFKETKKLPKHPVDYLKMIYADIAVNGWRPALECGYRFFGAERMVFATDYPFGAEHGEKRLRDHLESVLKWEIPEEEKKLILEKNSRRLLKIS